MKVPKQKFNVLDRTNNFRWGFKNRLNFIWIFSPPPLPAPRITYEKLKWKPIYFQNCKYEWSYLNCISTQLDLVVFSNLVVITDQTYLGLVEKYSYLYCKNYRQHIFEFSSTHPKYLPLKANIFKAWEKSQESRYALVWFLITGKYLCQT